MTRRFAVLSVDLDTAARGTGAAPSPEQCAALVAGAYVNTLPRLLGLLDKLAVPAVFYSVARDLCSPACAAALADAARRGHEVANHSLSHDRALADAPEDIFAIDLAESTRLIEAATGKVPVSFRMPGAVLRPGPLAVLTRCGYLCDSSLNSSLPYNAAKKIQALFSRGPSAPVQEFSSWHAPHEPYRPQAGNVFHSAKTRGGIIEYPLTPMPLAGLPFMNYFLSQMPENMALYLARRTCAVHSFVTLTAHDHEFAIEGDCACSMPGGMASRHVSLPLEERLRRFSALVGLLKRDFEFITPAKHAALIAGGEVVL